MKIQNGKSYAGAFGTALVSPTSIRRFQKDVLEEIRKQELELPQPAWRRKFRADLPFWKLLGQDQQSHLRQIFAHVLPDTDVVLDSFDHEEKLMLDVLSETYIKQAMAFAELVENQDYKVYTRLPRDYAGRILALTLSASLFFYEDPDEYGKRQYTYHNIYGNETIPSKGRCRVKGTFSANERIETLEFRSSPVQLLATHEAGVARKSGFEQESRQFQKTFVSTFLPIPKKAKETFTGFVEEATTSSEEPIPPDENDDPKDTNPDDPPPKD